MAEVRLEPWSASDHGLLARLTGDPAMMEHLGGAETPEKVAERHGRYVGDPGTFKIVFEGGSVGWVGFWERTWRAVQVLEFGWAVVPEFQGRGVAAAATRLALAAARADGRCRYAHAFPSVENAPSNAICAKAGFTLVEEVDIEFPPGTFIRCNDWRFDLGGG